MEDQAQIFNVNMPEAEFGFDGDYNYEDTNLYWDPAINTTHEEAFQADLGILSAEDFALLDYGNTDQETAQLSQCLYAEEADTNSSPYQGYSALGQHLEIAERYEKERNDNNHTEDPLNDEQSIVPSSSSSRSTAISRLNTTLRGNVSILGATRIALQKSKAYKIFQGNSRTCGILYRKNESPNTHNEFSFVKSSELSWTEIKKEITSDGKRLKLNENDDDYLGNWECELKVTLPENYNIDSNTTEITYCSFKYHKNSDNKKTDLSRTLHENFLNQNGIDSSTSERLILPYKEDGWSSITKCRIVVPPHPKNLTADFILRLKHKLASEVLDHEA
ncbi:uncharacterized protein L201_003736 [Kwoniella dendrophila CBS 6074]|uniref:Uncharacterized protein n=1 Tax=Kwoniella dendrophila CBS 6074 TaxID=1295534 RepID=A0AAX4JVI4_9TREE